MFEARIAYIQSEFAGKLVPFAAGAPIGPAYTDRGSGS
jgi:hypothetical protein